MPEQSLSHLQTIANQWQLLAFVWHGYSAVLLAGLCLGVHLSNRRTANLLGVPVASEATFLNHTPAH
jgi:succinate dehydrogenase/fumarate reductase cytochrome b subunit